VAEKSFGSGDLKISDYANKTFHPLDSVLSQTIDLSTQAGLPAIQVGPMDGLHLEVITRACNAKRAVEIGTLGGFSGTCIARGLSEGGRLYTLEISAENAKVARKAFELANVQDKVELIVGPALETLKTLSSKGPFDLIFIDADKDNYTNYLKWAEVNLKIGGVVLADNTFAFGYIADDSNSGVNRPSVKALREFNDEIANSPRFRATILPTGEGLTFAVKVK
jgi:caffeoyl-CoA O-methyltransferase